MLENKYFPTFLLSSSDASGPTILSENLGFIDIFYFPVSMPFFHEVLSIIVFGSIIFVWGVRYNNIKDEFKHFNLPKWLRDLVGIFKFAFAIMLLNDDYEISRLGASGIAVLMIAALITHIRLNSKASKMLPSLSLLCVCLVISYMCTQLSPST